MKGRHIIKFNLLKFKDSQATKLGTHMIHVWVGVQKFQILSNELCFDFRL